METPRNFSKDDLKLRPESLAIEGWKILENKINQKLDEIESLGYQIISTEKEMGGNDDFGNPAPEARHGAYTVMIQELKKKRDVLHKELKQLTREQAELEETDRNAVMRGEFNEN